MTIQLKFDNENAQAWFRSCLHRESAKPDSPWRPEFVSKIRELSYGMSVQLFDEEALAAWSACKDRIGPESSFTEARQDIVNQLKEGLS